MRRTFLDLTAFEQLKYLQEKDLKTQMDGDLLEFTGTLDKSLVIMDEDEKDYMILVHFNKGGLFNENAFLLYNSDYELIGKLVYSMNEKDAKISFDYFYVRKDMRGNHLGQTMVDYFLDEMYDIYGEEFDVFTNPYSFDVTFNGIKGHDYESQYNQYKLEQFYLKNNFILTEDPKKYVFSDQEVSIDEYKLTPCPVDDFTIFKNTNFSFGSINITER